MLSYRLVPIAMNSSSSDKTSCYILLNASAGAFSSSVTTAQIETLSREIGLSAKVIGTRSRKDMRARIRELIKQKADVIAVAGGDGTVALAVQEVAGSGSTLGIIPQGTFNNFATALRLPQDLRSALRVLKEGEKRAVDLGQVEVASHGKRFFTEAAGVGLFADALALYGKGSNKNFSKGLRALLRLLFSFRAHRLTLRIDGETQIERAVMCTVANTYRMAQGMAVAPDAKVTDGKLDVVIIGDLSVGEMLRYYRAFRTQTHLQLPKVSYYHATEIKISARRRLNVHCDDAFVGLTPAIMTAQPDAINVLVEKL
jgi:YegS/Rv2252/BmrU family lipid kinase